MAELFVMAAWSEAGSEAETEAEAVTLALEGQSHSGSWMEVAFSLVAKELYSDRCLMTWCGTEQVQQMWRRDSGVPSQCQALAEALKDGCGDHQG